MSWPGCRSRRCCSTQAGLWVLGALRSFAGRLSPPPPAPGKAIAAGSPWLLPLRLSAGTGLMERIQAIAQNVSDIAVKVDQILRHSLLLHSKGGGRGRLATPRRTEYRAVGCPAWGPISPCSSSPGSWGVLPRAVSGVTPPSQGGPSLPLMWGTLCWEAPSRSREYIQMCA